MSLRDVHLPEDRKSIPRREEAYIREGEERIRQFLEARRGATLPGFVPSDFRLVYRALRSLVASGLATGDCFLEWGSGFGVIAGMAASLGLNSHGIEIEGELVREAEELAEEFDLPVEFARGTFVPPGGDSILDQLGGFEWLSSGGPCGYESLGIDPEDFDIIFAYPWPGEEQVIEDLFLAYASDGALLVTYHGIDEVKVRRRVAPTRRR